ncbi:ParB/RepB/Spo0J family partition protein [Terriglobus aquaticus]|uniref:ParB/RepB/Spo0J family partition protein n=1 Tax=Terriglobus aquaticus TaxID=940139 RepID=A0ABW9KF10_9BACT|nr:ParB/RepB/Spo0J family partition protein [Terriglobus aquaticus]
MAIATSAKRPALGKGLDALLPPKPGTAPAAPSSNVGKIEASAAEANAGTPLQIPLQRIEPNPFQTRTTFEEGALTELANSIAATGVVQPITVRSLPNGQFQLIAGERRWLASKQAGKETIPAVVIKASDAQTMEMTIVENLQRADLNPMEQARAFERLGRDFHLTQEQMASRTGKDRASIGNFLRLLRLPPEAQEQLEAGTITFGHAKALMALETPEQILSAMRKVNALSLSVRATETYVKRLLSPEAKLGKAAAEEEQIDPNVKDAQDSIQRRVGLRTRIEDKKGKGRVIIEYRSLEDFDRLLELLGQ